MAIVIRRCIVAGRVQGVYYRRSAQARARELDVTGHARNLPDGRVEVEACGTPEAVDAFVAWLWKGPTLARVSAVEVTEVDPATRAQLPAYFSTG